MKRVSAVHSAAVSSATGAVNANVFDAIADWCDALHGDTPIQTAFAGLVRALGAEAGMIVRTRLSEFRPCRIVVHDSRAIDRRPLKSSYADEYFGRQVAAPRAGTVWLGSAHSDETSARSASTLPDWQSERGMKEFAVLVLAGGPITRDHIELHFREPLSPDVEASLAAVLPTMARTWATRRVGLITSEAVTKHLAGISEKQDPARLSLLGIGNPARLSRAEFRVCLLLSHGLSVAGVSAELGLTDATIRSHLRSIYAKSETSSLAELVFMLLRPHEITNEYEHKTA